VLDDLRCPICGSIMPQAASVCPECDEELECLQLRERLSGMNAGPELFAD
jgi:predicted nucleic acid-binding Zn ribbon protein